MGELRKNGWAARTAAYPPPEMGFGLHVTLSQTPDLAFWHRVVSGAIARLSCGIFATPQALATNGCNKYRALVELAALCVFTMRRYALHGLSYRNSVCLSVCHTRGLCPHGSTYDHVFFTI